MFFEQINYIGREVFCQELFRFLTKAGRKRRYVSEIKKEHEKGDFVEKTQKTDEKIAILHKKLHENRKKSNFVRYVENNDANLCTIHKNIKR